MKLIAHRGASAFEGENTLRSVKRAFKLGADMVEVDVRQSRDGELVVIHDSTVDRTTNGKGLVKEKTLKQLKELDAGNGEKIPTLREVLQILEGKVPADEIGLVIEIKEPGIEKQVLDILRLEEKVKKVIVASFYHNVSLNLKSTEKNIKTGVIFSSQPVRPEIQALDAKADFMFPFYQYLNEEMVSRAHNHGIEVYPGVIDSSKDLEFILSMDVDGFVTNNLIGRKSIK
ncbi:MAG: glycerophosphodiester phosphodiesterase [Methanobacteriaceae archaeon]|nr:glycerophosphodiester phosphodiesterase [Methanobacteriaceae archaeon]